jgi:hypothetical protein
MNMIGIMQMRMMGGVLIAIGIMAGGPVLVAALSDEGLVAEWHFDGDAKDLSGNGNVVCFNFEKELVNLFMQNN